MWWEVKTASHYKKANLLRARFCSDLQTGWARVTATKYLGRTQDASAENNSIEDWAAHGVLFLILIPG